MTALMPAGSPLLQELADGSLLDPDGSPHGPRVEGPVLGHNARLTRRSLTALARVNSRTRRALASQAAARRVPTQGE